MKSNLRAGLGENCLLSWRCRRPLTAYFSLLRNFHKKNNEKYFIILPLLYKGRYRKLFKQQEGICPVCHQHLENGEELHAHHVIPKKLGGKDAPDNLRLLHSYCHRQIHSNKAPLGVRQLLEPWCGATRSPGS